MCFVKNLVCHGNYKEFGVRILFEDLVWELFELMILSVNKHSLCYS